MPISTPSPPTPDSITKIVVELDSTTHRHHFRMIFISFSHLCVSSYTILALESYFIKTDEQKIHLAHLPSTHCQQSHHLHWNSEVRRHQLARRQRLPTRKHRCWRNPLHQNCLSQSHRSEKLSLNHLESVRLHWNRSTNSNFRVNHLYRPSFSRSPDSDMGTCPHKRRLPPHHSNRRQLRPRNSSNADNHIQIRRLRTLSDLLRPPQKMAQSLLLHRRSQIILNIRRDFSQFP